MDLISTDKKEYVDDRMTTPIHINMHTSPRSCTGWHCSCAAPYGFGENGNGICLTYGPGVDAEERDVKKFLERRLRLVVEMKKRPVVAETVFQQAKNIAHKRFLRTFARKLEDTQWHLDFEDQCRTQGFFEARERQRAYEADAPARERRLSWERYQDAELASSSRSIQSLKFEDY